MEVGGGFERAVCGEVRERGGGGGGVKRRKEEG